MSLTSGNNRISLLTPVGLPTINPGLVVTAGSSAACRQSLSNCIKLVLSGQPCSCARHLKHEWPGDRPGIRRQVRMREAYQRQPDSAQRPTTGPRLRNSRGEAGSRSGGSNCRNLPAGGRSGCCAATVPTRTSTNLWVAEVTTTVRGIPVEIPLGRREGMQKPCVVNCDNLRTVPRQALRERISRLGGDRISEVKRAVGYALGWEELIDPGI